MTGRSITSTAPLLLSSNQPTEQPNKPQHQQTEHTTVVQRKGLFDDPAEEINTLMHAIKEDIQGLNSLVEGTQVGGCMYMYL